MNQVQQQPSADLENLSPLDPTGAEESFPLTPAQESLWFIEQAIPGTAIYNIPEAWVLKGEINLLCLQEAFDRLVFRQEALRTCFRSSDGKPEQVIQRRAKLKLELVDLSGVPDPSEELSQRLHQKAHQPFDLSAPPLARVTLFRLRAGEQVLLINLHHLISDAWSLGLFIRELAAAYNSAMKRETATSDLPAIQYGDFVLWQRDMIESEAGLEHLRYWSQRFPSAPKPTLLTPDRRRTPGRSYQGQTQFFALPASLVKSLKDLSRQHGATLYMTLLAAFKVMLHRHTRENLIVIGSPVACRERMEVEGLLGLFVNTHALQTDLQGDPTFLEALARVREVVLDAYAHQELPSELLVKGLSSERAGSGHPLFEIVFGWQNAPLQDWNLGGTEATHLELETGTAKFDWTVLATECRDGLRLRSEFRTDLFEPSTMLRLMGQFQVLLGNILISPARRISEIPLLTDGERDQLIIDWNRTQSPYERDRRIHELFEARAAENPGAVALVHSDGSLSYAELNDRANGLAGRLLNQGVSSGDIVAICLPRSPELIVAMLAVLKAGAAYLPLDPDYPPDRLGFILRDAAVRVAVTNTALGARLEPLGESLRIISLDRQQDRGGDERNQKVVVPGGPLSPAYVMYTSGSTGEPKGTLIPHRAVIRLVRHTNYLDFSPDLVFLQSAAITFDASTFEIWGALLNGARLVLMPPAIHSLQELGRAVRQHRVTTLWLTAGLFDQMIEHQIEDLRGLKHLLAGGDVLSPATVSNAVRQLTGCRIINGYGPTENTTFSACYRVPQDWPEDQPVPIGQPIANTRVYVLDECQIPVPVASPAELCVAGDGLALGYVGRPELTSQKFIADPFSNDATRMYRTGDLVRWLPDGTLEFLGRIDDQVKIRGYRIEPGEVEATLTLHPDVAAAAVVVREDRCVGKQLVAYVAPAAGAAITESVLRDLLQTKLPAYLIPASIEVLERLPLTANGKVDRRALPEPKPSAAADFVGPRTATEQMVASIWSQLLGRTPIGVHDDFFRLGGHSLVATQVISRLSKACSRELPVLSIFEAPTVERLADLIDRGAGAPSVGEPLAITRSGPARAAELLERLDEFSEAELEELLRDPQLKSAL